MSILVADDAPLDEHTQEYRRSAAHAAAEGRRATVLCAPYSLLRRERAELNGGERARRDSNSRPSD